MDYNIYDKFPDGWDFTPDVGRRKSKAEVFTPLWVVNKMITDVGLIPEPATKGDYNFDKPLEVVKSRVVEPGIGTANFTSTILYHKLQYAIRAATIDGRIDQDLLEELFLTAVGSCYAFDIDCGNLEISKQRMLGNKTKLDAKTVEKYWVKYLEETVPEADSEVIIEQVKTSLSEAAKNWGDRTDSGVGIIDKAWVDATGQDLPASVRRQCRNILNENIKLFNGIKETATIDFVTPGWENINWVWWEFQRLDGKLKTSKEKVSLAEQLREGEAQRLREETDKTYGAKGLF